MTSPEIPKTIKKLGDVLPVPNSNEAKQERLENTIKSLAEQMGSAMRYMSPQEKAEALSYFLQKLYELGAMPKKALNELLEKKPKQPVKQLA